MGFVIVLRQSTLLNKGFFFTDQTLVVVVALACLFVPVFSDLLIST